MTTIRSLFVCVSLGGAAGLVACATGGDGTGAIVGGFDDGALEGSTGDDTAPADDAGGADADTCSDPAHGAAALFAAISGHAMTCTSSSQCPSGQCCFANSSVSACVMQ
jgi:hypothetical protein